VSPVNFDRPVLRGRREDAPWGGHDGDRGARPQATGETEAGETAVATRTALGGRRPQARRLLPKWIPGFHRGRPWCDPVGSHPVHSSSRSRSQAMAVVWGGLRLLLVMESPDGPTGSPTPSPRGANTGAAPGDAVVEPGSTWHLAAPTDQSPGADGGVREIPCGLISIYVARGFIGVVEASISGAEARPGFGFVGGRWCRPRRGCTAAPRPMRSGPRKLEHCENRVRRLMRGRVSWPRGRGRGRSGSGWAGGLERGLGGPLRQQRQVAHYLQTRGPRP